MEISDSPAYQAYLRARAAQIGSFTGDAGVRTLDAWREINAVSWRLARLNSDAWCYTTHELLRCTNPFQSGALLVTQLHPTVQRWRAWEERVLDLLGGAQAEVAATAEAYLPIVRYAAAAVPD